MEKSKSQINNYYNQQITGKFRGYTHKNERVEAAWKKILEVVPKNPQNILEIGCGIGNITHRLAQKFKKAKVHGIDISSDSIQAAKKLFANKNTSFSENTLDDFSTEKKYDLIVLMDVYEHIPNEKRNYFNSQLAQLLNDNGIIFLSFPTPLYQKHLRTNAPQSLQIVDEDIHFSSINELANNANCEVLYYKQISIWHYQDYAHAVLKKDNGDISKFKLPYYKETPLFIRIAKKLLNKLDIRIFLRKQKLKIQLKKNSNA